MQWQGRKDRKSKDPSLQPSQCRLQVGTVVVVLVDLHLPAEGQEEELHRSPWETVCFALMCLPRALEGRDSSSSGAWTQGAG